MVLSKGQNFSFRKNSLKAF